MEQRTRGLARRLTVMAVSLALGAGLGGPILAERAAAAPAETATVSGAAGTKVTTSDVNLRSAPSLDAPIVRVVAKGTKVTATGVMSGRFAQVIIDGVTNWLSSLYLADVTAPLPAVAYRAVTTSTLALRATPVIDAASAGDLTLGTTVALTGVHSASYSQVVYHDAVAWVLTGYLSTKDQGNGVPVLPTATGRRYVAVDEVNVRATSASNSQVIASAKQGTLLLITGKTANKRTEVIYNGTTRWAYTAYLSKTRPSPSSPTPEPGGSLGSVSLDRTNAYAHVIVREIRARFPQIKTIYGWRSSSAYSSDHPSGRALDIMIPNYKTAAGKALGDAIARYLQDSYQRLHVHYLIWRQRQWNVERNTDPTTGWRKMADRGSDTDNHLNHVHVSVYAVP